MKPARGFDSPKMSAATRREQHLSAVVEGAVIKTKIPQLLRFDRGRAVSVNLAYPGLFGAFLARLTPRKVTIFRHKHALQVVTYPILGNI